jgi:hypothetical protein
MPSDGTNSNVKLLKIDTGSKAAVHRLFTRTVTLMGIINVADPLSSTCVA